MHEHPPQANPTPVSSVPGARSLAIYYWRVITLGTLLFLLVVGWIAWSGWQRQYAMEVAQANQRVQESAAGLKLIIKAASDEVTHLRVWATNFPHHASYLGSTFHNKLAGNTNSTSLNGELDVDALAPIPSPWRSGQMLALKAAARPRASGAPSNLDLGLSLLSRVGEGAQTSDVLRWTYFNSAAKDMLVVAPWVSKKAFLGQETNVERFLTHAWTQEVATAALPQNNPLRRPYWTKAYLDQGGAGLMVSHAAPVYWGDEFVGVIGTDVQLEFLNRFVRGFHDQDGILSISNEYGQILAESRQKPSDADSLAMATTLPQRSLHGERWGDDLVFSASLDEPQWQILFRLPKTIVNARVAKAYSAMVYLLLILVLGSFLVNFVLWRMYVAPALQIADFVAHEFASTSPTAASVPRLWRPWLAAMAQAFGERHQYFAELQVNYEELEQLVNERTQALVEANNRLEKLSVTDPLTGAFNRRHLFDALETEYRRMARGGETMSVLMMDLDHFKKINDHFGHAAGDAVLFEFVRRSREVVRKTDLVFRYGGEEFVVLMSAMGSEGASQLAQRLGNTIAATPVAFEDVMIDLTVSIGVTSYHPPEKIEEMLARADLLLYQAKEAGRNRVMTESGVYTSASKG